MFSRKKVPSKIPMPKNGIKKMDAVVTGVILGGIVASIYGVKKISKKKDGSNIAQEVPAPIQKKQGIFRSLFGKKKKL